MSETTTIISAVPPVPGMPWGLGVTVTGNPIAADPSPLVTPPLAARILRPNHADVGAAYRPSGLSRFMFDIVGGTSIGCQPWFYDNALATWVKWGIPTSSDVPGAWAAFIIPMPPGIQWFIQITSVTGAVTIFRYALN